MTNFLTKSKRKKRLRSPPNPTTGANKRNRKRSKSRSFVPPRFENNEENIEINSNSNDNVTVASKNDKNDATEIKPKENNKSKYKKNYTLLGKAVMIAYKAKDTDICFRDNSRDFKQFKTTQKITLLLSMSSIF